MEKKNARIIITKILTFPSMNIEELLSQIQEKEPEFYQEILPIVNAAANKDDYVSLLSNFLQQYDKIEDEYEQSEQLIHKKYMDDIHSLSKEVLTKFKEEEAQDQENVAGTAESLLQTI